MRSHPNVLLVGFGNMGRALARGWLDRGHAAERIRVVDPGEAARAEAADLGLSAAAGLEAEAIQGADVILLAVKPDKVEEVAAALESSLSGQVVLSIAAGKRLASVEDNVGAGVPVVRVMPNTPAAVGRGMSVLCANAAVGATQREACTYLMEAVGAVEWVDDEGLMDAVTAVSGSGPAYVFLLIEALGDAGCAAGLPPALASKLALETVAGAGAYAQVADVDAGELRRRVTSPGGTTEAALDVLMAEEGLPALLERAVQAAVKRGAELAGRFGGER